VVSPNDFTNLGQVKQRLTAFEQRYNATALSVEVLSGQVVSQGCSGRSIRKVGWSRPLA
jgi:hypothetical protein